MVNILKLKDSNDNFREKHYFITFLFWLILFVWIGFYLNGKTEYIFQIFCLFIIISIGTKVVPYGTYSILVSKFSQTEKKVLSPGIYVFNLFFSLFSEIKGPFLLKRNGSVFLADEKINNTDHRLHFDIKEPLMTMPLTFGQGIFIKLFNWLFRKDFPLIVVYICISVILGGGLVFVKQSIFNKKEIAYQIPEQQPLYQNPIDISKKVEDNLKKLEEKAENEKKYRSDTISHIKK